MTKYDSQNKKMFSHYSDQNLIDLFNSIDSTRFPGSSELLVSEMKNRGIDVCDKVAFCQKGQMPNFRNKINTKSSISLFDLAMKYFEDKHNMPRILFKIIISALMSTFSLIVMRFSYIEGARGRYESSSSEMTYREACAYLKETLDKSIIIWLISFALILAYFVWKKDRH